MGRGGGEGEFPRAVGLRQARACGSGCHRISAPNAPAGRRAVPPSSQNKNTLRYRYTRGLRPVPSIDVKLFVLLSLRAAHLRVPDLNARLDHDGAGAVERVVGVALLTRAGKGMKELEGGGATLEGGVTKLEGGVTNL